jgi:hypothetical protein
MSSPPQGNPGRKILRRRAKSAFGGTSGKKSARNSNPNRKSAQPKVPVVDLSADSARYTTTTTMWEVLAYVTVETTPKALAQAMGKSPRQVRRITARLLEYGLISDRQRIKLVDNWEDGWEHLAVVKGTAGKKQSAVERLRQTRLARKRARLLYTGDAVLTDDGVVVLGTGEII